MKGLLIALLGVLLFAQGAIAQMRPRTPAPEKPPAFLGDTTKTSDSTKISRDSTTVTDSIKSEEPILRTIISSEGEVQKILGKPSKVVSGVRFSFPVLFDQDHTTIGTRYEYRRGKSALWVYVGPHGAAVDRYFLRAISAKDAAHREVLNIFVVVDAASGLGFDVGAATRRHGHIYYKGIFSSEWRDLEGE